jgi:hypothetical protein
MSLKDRLTIELEEVKNYLKLDPHDESEDAFLTDLINVAKEQADAYLNNDFNAYENGELKLLELPFSIKIACLKMIGTWYEIRTDAITSHTVAGFSVSFGEIPLDAERLLHPYRKIVGL